MIDQYSAPYDQADRPREVRDDRGDVPGWVMITVMSAGLVAILTAVAGPQLRTMLENALAAVGG